VRVSELHTVVVYGSEVGEPREAMRTWFLATRPQFLIISVLQIFLGTSVAWYDGYFSLLYCLLALIGLLLVHISVNMLNDYFDYKSGIDLEARRTPFSGGSGVLSAGLLTPSSVGRFALVCFLLAIPIGVYFVIVRGWLLVPILIAGALSVLLYTTHLTKWRLGEIACGLGLGTLPILGAYFVQSGTYTWEAVIAAIPSGILLYNALLINEFPDVEADEKAGRKNLPIVMGKRKASLLYSMLIIAMFVWIAVWSIAGFMPIFALLGLLTLPLGVKAIKGARSYDEESKLSTALGAHLMVMLGTQALLAVGYVISAIV
jgi:1,4-dihydroxy-2-naphthoate octaprenyltransferase